MHRGTQSGLFRRRNDAALYAGRAIVIADLGERHRQCLADICAFLLLQPLFRDGQRPPAVADPIVWRRGEQPRERDRELLPIRVHRRRLDQPVARLPPAAERGEREGMAEPCGSGTWIDFDPLVVVRQRRPESGARSPPQRIGECKMGFNVVRLVLHSVVEMSQRIDVPPLLFQHDPETVVRLGGRLVDALPRRQARDFFKFLHGAIQLAHEREGRPTFVMQRPGQRRVVAR